MKTGKIHTDVDYIQSDSTSLELAGGTHADKADFTPEIGMIRYNEDEKFIELYTIHGWKMIATEDQIIPTGGGTVRQGITEILRSVKRVATSTVHIQGNAGSGGIGSYNMTALADVGLPAAWSWNNVVNTGGSFKGENQAMGPNFLMFLSTARNYTLSMNVDLCTILGLPDSQRYNFIYQPFGGLSGFSGGIRQGGFDTHAQHIHHNIILTPLHTVNPLQNSDGLDTDVNYGKYRMTITGCVFANANYESEYSMFFNARKFKNF
jgi:hypothetical protein